MFTRKEGKKEKKEEELLTTAYYLYVNYKRRELMYIITV